MRRRSFIAGATAAAVCAHTARAQTSLPVIGFIDPRFPEDIPNRLRGFREGLKQAGYSEGENVNVEYRWAENQLDRLPGLATDLVRRGVGVIVASGGVNVAFAAKRATATLPILFIVSEDPVRLGLVPSFARPDGNLTGINFYNTELVGKRLEMLRELVPGLKRVAALVNPSDERNTETTLRDLQPATRSVGLQLQVIQAANNREIDAAFEAMDRDRPDALFVGQAAYLNSRRVQLVQLAASRMMPAAYPSREFTEIGGLMSYGSDITDAYRQTGAYSGRILKGATPSELPVLQASKIELIISAQTARMLGIAVPPSLMAVADEVIE